MSKIKVSVIVPVYNVEAYLRRCLDSLVNQTLEDIEIIVVNDGSPDNSQLIIDEYAEKYPKKIRAFIKENGGLSDARNYGIKKASGEYIGFVDSDDWVEPEMFALLYDKAVEDGADMVCCSMAHYFEKKVNVRYLKNAEYFGASILEAPEIIPHALSYACNKIFRREFWIKHEIEFPKGRLFEDTFTIYKPLLLANKVSAVNKPLYNYERTREQSIVNSYSPNFFDIFDALESVVAFYKEHDAFERLEERLQHLCCLHINARYPVMGGGNVPKKDIKRFVEKVFSFMDSNFTNWRNDLSYTYQTGKLKIIINYIRTHKVLLYPYLSNKALRNKISAWYKHRKRVIKDNSTKKISKEKQQNALKREAIQENGLKLMKESIRVLDSIGVTAFADFGTLLGIIREGRLLKHELDVDVGVQTNGVEIDIIKKALSAEGFMLWRRYLYGDKIVEESYKKDGIKIDFNYYEKADGKAVTYLFYRRPDKEYTDNTRNIVKMTYSPIDEFETVEVQGLDVQIPKNAEHLLEEKYGESWRVPDTGWIYWQSPAATPIPEIGRYITYTYTRPPVNKEQ